ncbi:MAG: hypothetical protein JRH15_23125 [Deltaproteobacteria bacterium]|nr:hypothetical protein [Deltaproteobacteria bacterium]
MKKAALPIGLMCLCLFLAANLMSHAAIRENRGDLKLSYSPPNLGLSPELIGLVAGEFKGLLADYLLLEIGSFIGSNQTAYIDDWKKICRTFEQVMALDPYFQQTYLTVQGNLPWIACMPEAAIKFLDISRKHRTWDWRPGHYMGFDAYYFLNDYEMASKIFLETAQIDGAPVIMALLGGRFALKSQQSEAAITLLESMLEDENLDENSQVEIKQRIAELRAGEIPDPSKPAKPAL